MSDLLFRLQSGKVRNLEETVEAWQSAHAEAMRALDAEDLIRECLTLPAGLEAVWERTRADAKADSLRDLQLTGLTLRSLLDRAVNVLNLVRRWVHNVAEETGHRIEGQEALGSVIEAIQRQRDRLVETWPWEDRPWPALNREMVAESRAGSARGEGEDASALLERARAGGSL